MLVFVGLQGCRLVCCGYSSTSGKRCAVCSGDLKKSMWKRLRLISTLRSSDFAEKPSLGWLVRPKDQLRSRLAVWYFVSTASAGSCPLPGVGSRDLLHSACLLGLSRDCWIFDLRESLRSESRSRDRRHHPKAPHTETEGAKDGEYWPERPNLAHT